MAMNELVQTASKFASRHIAPDAMEADHFDPRFPEEIFAAGIEAGFDRFILPESAGGNGFASADLCALVKTIAESCAAHAMVFGIHAAALKALHGAGMPTSASLVQKILQSGRPVAVTIPDPSSSADFDCALMATQGKRLFLCGDGGLAVNGSPSAWFVLFAKTPDGTPVALVSTSNSKTFVPGEPEFVLGLRATPICTVRADNHPVQEGEIIAIGPEAVAFYRSLISGLCMVTASASCGLMTGVVRKALKYARERYQGGRMIIDHSHIRNLLGRMKADTVTCWGAVSHLAEQETDLVAALGTKVSVTESAVRVCTDAVQILGGYGYMRDYGLEKAMRDAAVLSLLPVSNARAELLITAMERERPA